jgi:hypothetical protein
MTYIPYSNEVLQKIPLSVANGQVWARALGLMCIATKKEKFGFGPKISP